MAKGGQFERSVCKELSLWYSRGKDDNVFYRSQASGARATVRRKVGKEAKGHSGDIACTAEEGHNLIKSVFFELKRGYSDLSLQDLIDKPDGKHGTKGCNWHDWIEKASRQAKEAGINTWAIVARKDQRRSIIVAPLDFIPAPVDSQYMILQTYSDSILVMRLEDFFREYKAPELIKRAQRIGK